MLKMINYDNMMDWYLYDCKKTDFIRLLSYFSKGIGYGFDYTMLVFGDDPDENNPEYETDFPEIVGFDGVGFFNQYYPEPQLVSYQKFYNKLKEAVLEFISNKDKETKEQAKYYLSLIRERYNLIDEGEDILYITERLTIKSQ